MSIVCNAACTSAMSIPAVALLSNPCDHVRCAAHIDVRHTQRCMACCPSVLHMVWSQTHQGLSPVQFRSAILTAAQCATYDEVKRGVLATTGWEDGIHTHFSSAMIAGEERTCTWMAHVTSAMMEDWRGASSSTMVACTRATGGASILGHGS